MGISASHQPSYPQYTDFLLLINNADKYINNSDTQIWNEDQKMCLRHFFSPLQEKGSRDRFEQIRINVPRSKKIAKVYAFVNNGDDFYRLSPIIQNETVRIYAIITFLWLMFDDGETPAKYFYKSDHLHHIYKNDYVAIENTIHALEKVYFTNKNAYIASKCLIIPTCSFRLIEGQILSNCQQIITGPKTYTVMPNFEIANDPFYTLTPVRLEIFLTLPPDNLRKILDDIDIIIDNIKRSKIIPIKREGYIPIKKEVKWIEDHGFKSNESGDNWEDEFNSLFEDHTYIRKSRIGLKERVS